MNKQPDKSSHVAMPLAMASVGEQFKVAKINAGNGLCERLSSMGLVPGTALEVLNKSNHGPIIVSVKGSRVVLGRGMALKVLVE